MKTARSLTIDESTGFAQKLLAGFMMLTVVVTTAANLAFTFAPETMTKLVQNLIT